MKKSKKSDPEHNEELRQELKRYYLSNSDLEYLFNDDTNIISYDKLYNYRHIDEIFDKKGRCVLLYLTSDPNIGHWVALIKKGNIIEHFDPYGHPPDTATENLNACEEVEKQTGQDEPRLLRMIDQAGYGLEYNKYPFQKKGEGIGTCGRHTAARLLLYKLSLEDYKKLMKTLKDKNLKDFDDVVTKFTYDLLKK